MASLFQCFNMTSTRWVSKARLDYHTSLECSKQMLMHAMIDLCAVANVHSGLAAHEESSGDGLAIWIQADAMLKRNIQRLYCILRKLSACQPSPTRSTQSICSVGSCRLTVRQLSGHATNAATKRSWCNT